MQSCEIRLLRADGGGVGALECVYPRQLREPLVVAGRHRDVDGRGRSRQGDGVDGIVGVARKQIVVLVIPGAGGGCVALLSCP